jgi:3-dehydroquinate synthase
MTTIKAKDYAVYFNSEGYKAINKYVSSTNISKIFILVDTNTHDFCLPLFLSEFETHLDIEIIEIEAGEINKNIDTCKGVWEALSELEADRKALLINLGGGVVTDLGGFVACTYQRGIKYINVPTTLLSMVDASVGGKTGVDLGVLKNQVGVISNGELVIIDSRFLNTLPYEELRSGLAEMFKHGLIYSRQYWDKFKNITEINTEKLNSLIWESVDIKNNIVTEDPREENIRKTLNFGHTLGHAIESYFLNHNSKNALLHGEAIAAGMLMEALLSLKITELPENDLNEITQLITRFYPLAEIESTDYEAIINLMKYDKKNSHGNVNFVLLKEIGQPILDCNTDNELIKNAFKFYRSCYK